MAASRSKLLKMLVMSSSQITGWDVRQEACKLLLYCTQTQKNRDLLLVGIVWY
jgi:hypothetical protein